METVYIYSIDKKISMEEFLNHTYQPGHAYKINDHYFQKCISKDLETNEPKIESITILSNINGGIYQLDYTPNEQPMPSGDFVNCIMSGKIKEVDPEKFDQLVMTFKEMSHSLERIALSI